MRAVARRQDRGVAVSPQVARRGHHYHPFAPGCFHHPAERIPAATLVDGAAEGQVDHPDVVLALELHRLLDRGDHHAVVAHAVAVENTKIEDIGVWRHTTEGAE